MKKYILLILCTALTVLFPIFASAEGNTVSITDFGSINDAIAAAGAGGIVEYPAGEYGGITLNGASNANDITILFDEGVKISSLSINSCNNLTVGGIVEVTGNVIIHNVTNFVIEDMRLTENGIFELIGLDTIGTSNGAILLQPKTNIRLERLETANAETRIRNVNGLVIDKLISKNAPASAVVISDIKDLYINSVKVYYPNRNNSNAAGNMRAVLLERIMNGKLSEYRLEHDDNYIRSFESGGNNASFTTDGLTVDKIYYYNTKSTASHDIVLQGGTYAPKNISLNMVYCASGVENPVWNSYKTASVAEQTPAFAVENSEISQSGETDKEINSSFTLYNPYKFKRTLKIAECIYNADGACIAKTVSDEYIEDEAPIFTLTASVPSGETAKTAKIFVWDAENETEQIVPTITFDFAE